MSGVKCRLDPSSGSKGRPLGSKFFQYHAVWGKIRQNRILNPPEGWCPTSEKSWIRHWTLWQLSLLYLVWSWFRQFPVKWPYKVKEKRRVSTRYTGLNPINYGKFTGNLRDVCPCKARRANEWTGYFNMVHRITSTCQFFAFALQFQFVQCELHLICICFVFLSVRGGCEITRRVTLTDYRPARCRRTSRIYYRVNDS